MVAVRQLLAFSLLLLVLALPASAQAAPGKVSLHLVTGTQAQALKSKELKVRATAARAMRVSLTGLVGKKAVTRRKTVRLRRGKGRTVSLRLTPGGRRLLAACSSRSVTVAARGGGSKASTTRSLLLNSKRCRAAAPKALPGCGDAEKPGGDWPFYSGTLNGHRRQLAEKWINPGNIAGLGVDWKTTPPDGGVIHSTPTVAGGCVYTGTEFGNVYALNADTGKIVWSQALGDGGEGSGFAEGAGIVGSPAIANGLVYVAATTPKASVLSALDQATGKVVWKVNVDEDEGGGLDSSPVPFKGMVFQAFKGDESSNHSWPGFVIVDGSRGGGGKVLVKTHNIPKEDFDAGYRGGSTINTPAVDLDKMMLFAGTGNPASPKQHPVTNALLKIDVDPKSPTFGKIVASHRGTSDSYPSPQDIDSPVCQTELQWPIGRLTCAQFDFNFLASPNLWTNSQGRPLVGALQKSGVYTAVYRDTMERAWQATVGLPCLACNLSSSAADDNGIYVAVSGGNLYSLNKDTGAVQWATPVTGGLRYNGVAVANGIVYSLNDALGTIQAYDTGSGRPLFSHPFFEDNGTPMHDMGNSSGVSVARNQIFATSQWDGSSTLFALKLGAAGADGDGGDGQQPPSGEQPPPSEEQPPPEDGGGGGGQGFVATGPGATSYGYLTPIVFVNKGGTVSYTNMDVPKHNVSSPDGLFRSELAGTGETVPVTGVEKLNVGTYNFLCEPHPGMKGQLVVQ